MLKILVLFLICLSITAWEAKKTHGFYLKMHNPSYDNHVVDEFFGWLRGTIAVFSITAALLVMTVAEIVADGLSPAWEDVTIVSAVVAGIFGMLLTLVIQGIVHDMMNGRKTWSK